MTATVDVKETGQKKTINGFNASEVVMTIAMEGAAPAQGMKMQMEMDMWLSSDVPGAQEFTAACRNIAIRTTISSPRLAKRKTWVPRWRG